MEGQKERGSKFPLLTHERHWNCDLTSLTVDIDSQAHGTVFNALVMRGGRMMWLKEFLMACHNIGNDVIKRVFDEQEE